MRIAVNASFVNETPAGVGVFARAVSSALSALHSETYILSSVEIPGIPREHIIRTPLTVRGSLRLANNTARLLFDNAVVPLLLKRFGIDILFCPITEYPLIRSARQVVAVHDLHPLYFPEQFGLASVHFGFSIRHLPRFASRVTVSSQFVKGELLKRMDMDAGKIDVVHLAYDAAVFRPSGQAGRSEFVEKYGLKTPYIVFVGSLMPYKNVKTLIQAFLSVKDAIPHDLVIVGSRKVAAGTLPQDARLHYYDYVASAELPCFYSYADLLVHPSLFEGFGITPLEAMACGTPVIASTGGALPEVVGEAGLLFPPQDAELLAELIVKVVSNRGLHAELVRKGFENVRRFSWEKTARGILASCERASAA